MFEQTLIAIPEARRERAIVLALIAQTVLVTGMGLLPLLGVQRLGPLKQMLALPPVQAVEKAAEKPRQEVVARARPLFSITSLRPRSDQSARVVELAPIGLPAPLMGSTAGPAGESVGVPLGDIQVAPPLKTAPPEVKAVEPVRLTSVIAQSQLVYGPKPVYPHLAVMSRSEGIVKLQAIISREGKIENLHVMSGPALLVGAAMDAVQMWRYRPLLLNGEPVEVITEIDVVFTLQR